MNMIEIGKFSKIIIANWKLNGSLAFVGDYLRNLNNIDNLTDICGIICPPSAFLQNFLINKPSFFLGGQDCSIYNQGSYTGEISAFMLKQNKCDFCIVGHSERRHKFRESNNNILIKTQNLIKESINPIICIGETLEEKQKGLTKEILYNQIIESVPENASINNAIIAYEPVWAIGSGQTPSVDEIEKIHSFIKEDIKNYENFKVVYGGSVNSRNIKEISNLNNVDGVLVGGASLDPLEFVKIIKAC